MNRKAIAVAAVFAVGMAAPAWPVRTQSRSSGVAVLYEGARLIPGDGRQSIPSAALLVENGMIVRVGPKGNVTAPRGTLRVDLTGKTVMPPLINAHGHPGFQRGLT